MQKWEYLVMTVGPNDKLNVRAMGEMGADGWELAGIMPNVKPFQQSAGTISIGSQLGTENKLIFKRPVQEGE